jgi:hypothetical protein
MFCIQHCWRRGTAATAAGPQQPQQQAHSSSGRSGRSSSCCSRLSHVASGSGGAPAPVCQAEAPGLRRLPMPATSGGSLPPSPGHRQARRVRICAARASGRLPVAQWLSGSCQWLRRFLFFIMIVIIFEWIPLVNSRISSWTGLEYAHCQWHWQSDKVWHWQSVTTGSYHYHWVQYSDLKQTIIIMFY